MFSTETIKWRLANDKLEPFDLVFWKGTGRVVGTTDTSLSLLVRGKRADYTWDRLALTLRRLHENYTLSVDELGGQHDAVGLVSLIAALDDGHELLVDARGGVLRLPRDSAKPVISIPDTPPPDWTTLERKISGD